MRGLRLGLSLTGTATAPAANLGPELISHGTGDATTNWTANSGSITATGTALRVTAAGGFGQAQQTVSGLTIGLTYRLSATFAPSTGDYGRVSASALAHVNYSIDGSPGHKDFVADSTTTTIYLETVNGADTWEANGQYVDFTASLKEVLS